MGEEKTITGVGLDYIYYYAPQNVQLSVSSDGNTWNYLGKVATADENADYYQFIESITARYVKFDLLASWDVSFMKYTSLSSIESKKNIG